jgi:hypothetical protein
MTGMRSDHARARAADMRLDRSLPRQCSTNRLGSMIGQGDSPVLALPRSKVRCQFAGRIIKEAGISSCWER